MCLFYSLLSMKHRLIPTYRQRRPLLSATCFLPPLESLSHRLQISENVVGNTQHHNPVPSFYLCQNWLRRIYAAKGAPPSPLRLFPPNQRPLYCLQFFLTRLFHLPKSVAVFMGCIYSIGSNSSRTDGFCKHIYAKWLGNRVMHL